jgi:ATP-dependent Clp endopeptidase proteolytic subunit ClpP
VKDIYWLGHKRNTDETDKGKNNIFVISDSGGDTEDKIERSDNRLYFYSEVSRSKVLQLNKEIRNLNVDIMHTSNILGLEEKANIYLHINSFGGSVFAGLAAVDYIKKSEVPIVSIIDGSAASAATLMSIVAKERYMHENSFMLIHQLSSGLWGKYEDLKDDMKNNDLLMKTIKGLYQERTKIPKTKLNQILKHDLWFDAKTCLKYGLVDDII